MELALNEVYCLDCVKGLAKIAPGSIDLAFADPPFNIGYKYDVYVDRQSAKDYLDWSRQWMAGTARALKPTGTFWLAIGDEYAAELKLIAQQELGFTCRSWVIWYYTFGVNCTRAFSRSHTHLLYFVKDAEHFTFNADDPAVRVPSARQLVYADGRANPRGRLPDNTWILRPHDVPGGFALDHDTWYFPRVAGTFKERQGFHGCQMPEQLLGRIIRCSSNPMESVLDPFGGSGTTFAVAKKLGRRWIGFELSPEYVQRIRARLRATRVGDPLDGTADPLSSVPPTALGKRRLTPVAPRRVAVRGRVGRRASERSLDGRDVERGILSAYLATHGGHSVDQVLADPELDGAFAEACRRSGLPGGPAQWNRALLRIRKSGRLPRLASRARTLTLREMDGYSFASEVAMRQLGVDSEVAMDEILCVPELAQRFDRIAESYSPGYTPFQYRWAALAIRKRAAHARRLAQQRGDLWRQVWSPRTKAFSAESWAECDYPGVYLLLGQGGVALYVGETCNLRHRLEQTSQIAQWRSLEPSGLRLVRQDQDRCGLQSFVMGQVAPAMNWALLCPLDGRAQNPV